MSKEKPFPLRIVLLILLGWLAIVFPRMLISPLLPTIEDEFHVSHGQAALLMSSYLLSYAIVQLPAGSLSDRFGNKLFMILALLGTSVGSLLMGFTSTFDQALAVRLLAGTLSGLWFASSSKMIAQYTSSSRRGRALGIVYSGGSIGTILIYVMVGVSSNGEVGWRYFFMISSIPGFLCLALTYFFAKDLKEKGVETENEGKDLSLEVVMKNIKSRPLILSLVFTFLSSLASWSLGTFIPTYLIVDRRLLVAEASSILMVQAVPSIFSSFLGGYVADRLGFRFPLVVSEVAMCLVSLLIPLSPLGIPMWVLLLFWGLIGGWSYTVLNLFVLKAVHRKLRGTLLGLYNQVGFIGATVGPPIFGFVIDIGGFAPFFTLSLILYITSLPIALLIRDERHEMHNENR